MEIIKLDKISVSYGENNVLDNFSLVLEEGKAYVIKGSNGIGKTTLINILGLLVRPDNGKIEFFGKDIGNKKSVHDRIRKDNIGIISQDFALIFDSTVYENIALSLHAIKSNPKKIKEKVLETAEILEITHLLDKYPSQLSGGECQKTAIARALVKYPKILLADEATASLDEKSKKKFINIIREYVSKGNTVVLVTHENEKNDFCDFCEIRLE